MSTNIFTVGYQGRSIDEFVDLLETNGVTCVIDVRELPLSRRQCFSKTHLRERLESEGISYVHVRKAGNPYRKLKAEVDQCLALFRQHVDKTPDVLLALLGALEGETAALLCVEAAPEECHRSVLAEKLSSRGLFVVHL